MKWLQVKTPMVIKPGIWKYIVTKKRFQYRLSYARFNYHKMIVDQ